MRWLGTACAARRAAWGLVAAASGMAVGMSLSAASGGLPGSAPLMAEDVADQIGLIGLGILGVLLLRYRVARNLGFFLVVPAYCAGLTWLASGLADWLATEFGRSIAAQLLNLTAVVLFIPTFVVVTVAPLLLFPTGQLPSRSWVPAVWAAVVGVGAAMLSTVAKPGLIDEEVPAWGDNPMGVAALDGVLSVTAVIGAILVMAAFITGVAAVVRRLISYRGARRQQMWWFLAGAAPLVVGVSIDFSDSTVYGLVSATVIFSALVAGMWWALLGTPGRDYRAAGAAP
jgi:hypothetical protein